ncbi:MAG: GNAT family N-acetyltransferase [Chloroflexi bacterium]|nr:GNAT family N-acetyltransferase [Chloroflexota bacterium]
MTQPKARLTRPHRRYKASYIDALWEFISEGRAATWHPEILRRRFDEYLRVLRQAESEPLAGMVPASRFWLIGDTDHYLGDVDVRHCLNEALGRYGGHIGYNIRPSERRKGYGKLICRLGILEARKLGIGDILITCDDDNIGSRKVIEANGGRFQDRIDNGRAVLTRRYWILAGE